MPAQNYIPTLLWEVGDEVLDHRRIALPADLPPDHYWVAAGVYDTETVIRLEAVDGTGASLDGNLFVVGEFDYVGP